MKLNHLNLCVPDVAKARDFFEQHFGLSCVNRRGETLSVMDDGDGFILALSNFGGAAPNYPKGGHIGFLQETPQQVDAAYARLKAAGLDVGRGPRQMHGSHAFYFMALGTVLIEVSCWVGEA